MVQHHSDSERGNPLLPHGLLFPISSKGSFMCGLCYTSHGALAGMRNTTSAGVCVCVCVLGEGVDGGGQKKNHKASRSYMIRWKFEGRKEGNVLFNDTHNTFYLQLYGVRHMVKDHSDSEKGNPLPPHGLLLPISSKVLLYAPSHR